MVALGGYFCAHTNGGHHSKERWSMLVFNVIQKSLFSCAVGIDSWHKQVLNITQKSSPSWADPCSIQPGQSHSPFLPSSTKENIETKQCSSFSWGTAEIMAREKTMAFTRPLLGVADGPVEVFFCQIPVLWCSWTAYWTHRAGSAQTGPPACHMMLTRWLSAVKKMRRADKRLKTVSHFPSSSGTHV